MAKNKQAANEVEQEPATTAPTEATEATEKTTKSIVPAKYAGRYKDGGSDELSAFIKQQCSGKEGFEFGAFFELAKKNGVDAAKVDHYASQVAEKRHGAQGRARMTIRNMLATFARKNGKLVGLNGEEFAINLPKAAVSGAAAKAQENSAGTGEPESAAGAEAGAF